MKRTDNLPSPVTGEDQYLAAILDEIRGLRADLATRNAADSGQVREPEPPQGGSGVPQFVGKRGKR